MKKIIIFISLFIITILFTVPNEQTKSIIIENGRSYDLNYYKEYYNNNDIVGIIKIDGTKINDFIVKTIDNSYYLDHGIDKKYNVKGSIFLDYRTNLNSNQINIYGHNSNYYEDIPFKELEKYLNKEFYNNHKYIEIWDGINNIKYEIFSIQIVTTDFEHMNVNPINLQKHIDKINKSIYETGINADVNDKILVLQTCNYNPKDSYIVIYSKKI